MKKILLFTLCVFLLSGCGTSKETNPESGEKDTPTTQSSSLSAKAAMEQYFQFWNSKDREKLLTMEADVGIPKEGYAYNFDIEKAEIKTIEVAENPKSLSDASYSKEVRELYENPAEIAEVSVIYDVIYPEGKEGPDNAGQNQRVFYLVKETKDSSWVITASETR